MNPSQLFKNIFTPMHNCELTTFRLCKLLNVPVTTSIIRENLRARSNYPSILSVSDILSEIGVENIVISSITIDKLQKLSVPVIAQIRVNNQGNFVVVDATTTKDIMYFDPTRDELITSRLEAFGKLFTGYVLLGERNKKYYDKDYLVNTRETKRPFFSKLLGTITIPTAVVIICVLVFVRYGLQSVQAIVFTLLILAGSFVATLLLWYEVDQFNPTLQQICSAGVKKTNCAAILRSKASKVFGISWSVIGFIYFAGNLINFLVTGIYQIPNLYILFWFNALALPYIAFSLYYQEKVANQWWVLCLSIQITLALQFAVALWGEFQSINAVHLITSFTIVVVIISFFIPFLIVSILLPALQKGKESNSNKIPFQKLKCNPHVFEVLLSKQKEIAEPTEGLGITLAKPNAKHKLIKICNPYCDPCSKAHQAIEALLDNNPNVQLQIIITAAVDENDNKTPPVRHLLAIAQKSGEDNIKNALDDWYRSKPKDYESFAAKYPMNEELKLQDHKIEAMHQWCIKEAIRATPTFYLNRHQLPEIYSAADLKYFLSV